MYQTNSTNSMNSAMNANSFVPIQHDMLGDGESAHNTDLLVIDQVFKHYHHTLKMQPDLVNMLIDRKVAPDYIDHFRIGFSDRSLGYELQSPKCLLGSRNRGHLQRLGLLKETGHEFFRGAMVIPYNNDAGQIVGAYGRRPLHQRRTPAYHLYWNAQQVSFFNATAEVLPSTLILCKSAIDALTLLTAGLDNVVSTMGTQGFNEHQLERLLDDGVRRVYIAFDNTPSANHYALLVAQAIDAVGVQCQRVNLPLGQDVNRFAMSCTDVAAEFNRLIDQATPFKQRYGVLVHDVTNVWLKQPATLKGCVHFYLEEQKQAGRALRTLSSSRIHLERFQDYCHTLGVELVTELSASLLVSYRHYLSGEKNIITGRVISATTKKERMEAVVRMLARLHYYGITQEALGSDTHLGPCQ